MKKIVLFVLSAMMIISAAGCATKQASVQSTTEKVVSSSQAVSSEANAVDAQDIIDILKKKSKTIGKTVSYTDETDLNHLLGRPKQYISKADFADTRLGQYDPECLAGGTVETFNNEEDLKNRKEYIESLEGGSPAMSEYIVANGKYLLRLDHELTKKQAENYVSIFKTIK